MRGAGNLIGQSGSAPIIEASYGGESDMPPYQGPKAGAKSITAGGRGKSQATKLDKMSRLPPSLNGIDKNLP